MQFEGREPDKIVSKEEYVYWMGELKKAMKGIKEEVTFLEDILPLEKKPRPGMVNLEEFIEEHQN